MRGWLLFMLRTLKHLRKLWKCLLFRFEPEAGLIALTLANGAEFNYRRRATSQFVTSELIWHWFKALGFRFSFTEQLKIESNCQYEADICFVPPSLLWNIVLSQLDSTWNLLFEAGSNDYMSVYIQRQDSLFKICNAQNLFEWLRCRHASCFISFEENSINNVSLYQDKRIYIQNLQRIVGVVEMQGAWSFISFRKFHRQKIC